MNNSSSFSKDNGSHPIKNKNTSNSKILYDIILSQEPISLWKLKEITPFSYSYLKRKVREFEFVGLVKSRSIKNNSNRDEKIIFIEKKESDENANN
jgi:DNA-binding transcriptional regulator GbsR (MarR family)